MFDCEFCFLTKAYLDEHIHVFATFHLGSNPFWVTYDVVSLFCLLNETNCFRASCIVHKQYASIVHGRTDLGQGKQAIVVSMNEIDNYRSLLLRYSFVSLLLAE